MGSGVTELVIRADNWDELIVNADGIDTEIFMSDTGSCGCTSGSEIRLTWVQAMQLHRWLGERLGQ